jgi:predicted amidohydrolase YtcJ
MGFAEQVVMADSVHTMVGGPGFSRPITAIAVTDGRISAVGTREDTAAWIGEDTFVTDFGSATITPGLSDGHSHPIMGAVLTAGGDLTAASTLAEVQRIVATESLAAAPGDWVFAWGLAPDALSGLEPHRDLIDSVTAGHPAVIRLFDGHSMLVNTLVLGLAGIDGAREFDQGAIVAVDADGAPTGLLIEEAAMVLVDSVLPQPDPAAVLESFIGTLTAMAHAGLTGTHIMDFVGEPYPLLEAAEASGELPLRLVISPWCRPGSDETEWARLADQQGVGGRRWQLSGIKFFMDGTIDNGTAWLEQPDTRGESAHAFWPDPSEYSRAVAYFASRGIGTATHAIGDAAVRHVLDTVASLPASSRSTHRIEHIETLPPELASRFAALGVVASMQPTHCTHFVRADHSDNWSVRLGPSRADRAFRIRELRDAGATVVLGSDWPIAPFDPREIMADAQLRRRAGHPLDPTIGADQALTALMALEGYTSHSALADGRFGDSGVIAVGARADLTVFASDPLVLSPDDLAVCEIVATLVDGRLVFDSRG